MTITIAMLLLRQVALTVPHHGGLSSDGGLHPEVSLNWDLTDAVELAQEVAKARSVAQLTDQPSSAPPSQSASLSPPSAEGSFTSLLYFTHDNPITEEKVVRFATEFYRSGVHRHPQFFELLVCAPGITAASGEQLRKAIQTAYQAVDGKESPNHDDVEVRVRVNVITSKQVKGFRDSATRLLLLSVLAVRSEFFLLESHDWMPMAVAPSEGSGEQTVHKVHQILSVGISALSERSINGPQELRLRDLSDAVYPRRHIPAANHTDLVHVFRLATHTPAHHPSPEETSVMRKTVKHLMDGNENADGSGVPSSEAAPCTSLYDCGAPVHCELAPLYNIRQEIPANHQANTSSSSKGSSPPVIRSRTYCEALLQHRKEPNASFARWPIPFHEEFCESWRQLTSRRKSGKGDEVYDITRGVCAFQWLHALKLEELRSVLRGSGGSGSGNRVMTEMLSSSASAASKSSPLVQFASSVAQNAPTDFTRALILSSGLDPERESYTTSLPLLRSRIHNTSIKVAMDEGDGVVVVCVPSHEALWDDSPALYSTEWFVSAILMRCMVRGSMCVERAEGFPAKALHKFQTFVSSTGRWAHGKYQVCFTTGTHVRREGPLG